MCARGKIPVKPVWQDQIVPPPHLWSVVPVKIKTLSRSLPLSQTYPRARYLTRCLLASSICKVFYLWRQRTKPRWPFKIVWYWCQNSPEKNVFWRRIPSLHQTTSLDTSGELAENATWAARDAVIGGERCPSPLKNSPSGFDADAVYLPRGCGSCWETLLACVWGHWLTLQLLVMDWRFFSLTLLILGEYG